VVIDDRGREDRGFERRGPYRLLGHPLGAKEAGALGRARVERAEEDEPPHPGPLGRLQQSHRRQAVQLLDPPRRLVANRRRQVDDGVDAAEALAHRMRIGELAEVPQRDLHVDPPRPQAARVADQAAHVLAALEEQRQQPRADAAGRPGQQQHRNPACRSPAIAASKPSAGSGAGPREGADRLAGSRPTPTPPHISKMALRSSQGPNGTCRQTTNH
jgi:hypothetical protein